MARFISSIVAHPFVTNWTKVRSWRRGWLLAAVMLYGVLASYQLGLPGLHYDEAKEAGVNAMELLTGAPVTAFRDAGIHIFGVTLPLMVQDYIGALNVYLSLPFLALSGIGVPNLRMLPLLTGVASLFLLERALSEWIALHRKEQRSSSGYATPIAPAGLLALTLLAASSSFVFWSRQGIFVTNLTQPLSFLCIWQGLRWLRTGQNRPLTISALAGGLAIYSKLLAIWVVGAFALLVIAWLLWRNLGPVRVVDPDSLPVPNISIRSVGQALLAFGLAISPLILFNLQSGGTVASVGENLGQSYYGVNNADILGNLPVRIAQMGQVLRGDQFWYLGGVFGNDLAPWLAGLSLIGAVVVSVRSGRSSMLLMPLALLAIAAVASLFTVSDLFVTHYALLHPVLVGVVGLALQIILESASPVPPIHTPAAHSSDFWRGLGRYKRLMVAVVVIVWLTLDLLATVRYHQSLSRSGGLADHSDASYHLAYHLRYNGLGAPIVLDWGIDAPVRYLSEGTVAPIEIFGYSTLDRPDDGFAQRLGQFLNNPENVYLLHTPGATVFAGRREAFFEQARLSGGTPTLLETFSQRDGTPLFELWQVR
jgi:hypothetical protein